MRQSTRLALWLGFVGLLTALNYDARAVSGKPDPNVLYRYSTAVGGVAQYAVMLAVVLAIAGGSHALLGLRRVESRGRAAWLAAGVIVGILAFERILDPFLHPGREQGLTPTTWEPSHAAQYAANFVVIAVVGPVVEELTYRGLGYSLLARFGRWTAIAATGILFALSHGLVEALPVLAVFGWGLAWLRSRTGSVYPGMIVHGCFNGVALIVAVLTAR